MNAFVTKFSANVYSLIPVKIQWPEKSATRSYRVKLIRSQYYCPS